MYVCCPPQLNVNCLYYRSTKEKQPRPKEHVKPETQPNNQPLAPNVSLTRSGITSTTQKLREMFAKDEDTRDTSTLTKVVGLKNIDGYLSPAYSSQILPSDQMANIRSVHL